MKLYYIPGACSLATHIALREAGAPFELDQVDKQSKTTGDGTDFLAVNPKGYVPALRLDDGEVVTEGAAVLQYVADNNPEAGLAPANGTLERTRMQETLNYLSSELHKAFGPFFAASPPKGTEREEAEARLASRFEPIEAMLSDGRAFLGGETFTVADAYLFVIAGWAKPCGIDLARWPNVAAHVGRVAQRPAARDAMQAEGLIN